VNAADTTTAITSDSPDPSVVGQTVTVQYSVSVTAPGAGTPTGNVTVTDGAQSCTGTVAAGQCSITFTSAGAKSLTAGYVGNANFNGSTSAAASHQVNKAATTTTITSDDADPSTVGQAVTVTYTVTVNAPGAGTPTGNVTVSDGVDSCTGTAAAGQCDITLSTVGSRTLTAVYAGDSNLNGSTSADESHTVNGIATTTAITSDTPDPSVVGQSVTVQYSVTPSSDGTPTGTSPSATASFRARAPLPQGSARSPSRAPARSRSRQRMPATAASAAAPRPPRRIRSTLQTRPRRSPRTARILRPRATRSRSTTTWPSTRRERERRPAM
jgi:hypothetical protein